MNRRSFLSLALVGSALVGSALGVAGCSAPSAPVQTAAAASARPAPPIAEQATGVALATPVMPDRLEIPRIDVDIPVVELGWSRKTDRSGQIFSEWDVAEYAAGWHKNSARLGEPGNMVMSGHNNILGAVFRELDQLKQGDDVLVWADNRQYRYAVEQVVVVPEERAPLEQRIENARWIGPFDDDRLTLVSCWPRNNNTHRIIVVAKPQRTALARP
jgi:sortase A